LKSAAIAESPKSIKDIPAATKLGLTRNGAPAYLRNTSQSTKPYTACDPIVIAINRAFRW
jgi:hypothetical protein